MAGEGGGEDGDGGPRWPRGRRRGGAAGGGGGGHEGAEEAYRAFGNARRADAMTAMVILGAMTAGVCSSLVDRRWGARR